jgi:hypothetical protein
MLKYSLFAILFVLNLTALANDRPWYHINLANGSVQISVDFQLWENRGNVGGESVLGVVSTHALWINVTAPDLGPHEVINAMIINKADTFHGGTLLNADQEIFEQKLRFADANRYTASFSPLIVGNIYRSDPPTIRRYHQELVIWINGQIIKCPLSGNNFSFNMAHISCQGLLQ